MNDLFKAIDNKQKQKLLRFLEASTLICKKNNIILSSVKQDNIICLLVINTVSKKFSETSLF